tara:strand:+ start:586 stop:879 length:294 start_codon:yes stop_codon:yes gene_type:complete
MKTSIKKELTSYINDCKADGREVTRFNLFNEDYYIIGYYNCSEWLKEHDLDAFEAISIVKDYEMDNFGSFTTDINSEGIVNMLFYIYGEELCNELGI